MSYAWVIDRDHLTEHHHRVQARHNGQAADTPSGAGITGPNMAPDWMLDVLNGAAFLDRSYHVYPYQMADDDGVVYYSGRMVTDEGKTEAACSGPLRDFGAHAGAVTIRYTGHPEMDC